MALAVAVAVFVAVNVTVAVGEAVGVAVSEGLNVGLMVGVEVAVAGSSGAVTYTGSGEDYEAGDVITFLASERASYLTGVAINIDGGASAVV